MSIIKLFSNLLLNILYNFTVKSIKYFLQINFILKVSLTELKEKLLPE